MADTKPKSRGLGRGLNALFEDEESFDLGTLEGSAPAGKRFSLGVELLAPGRLQPRSHFNEEALDQLAESIRAHGLLQPILVRKDKLEAGRYEIIAGERRWRAAQRAQLHEVPVIAMELEDVAALEIALIENLQREDLNPIEEARGYQKLLEEYGHTQDKLGKSLGKSRSHIANTIRLLNLPSSVQKYLEQGELTAGHARALVTADNPEALAKEILSKGLSVRETEALANEARGKPASGASHSKSPKKDVDTLALENDMTNRLGMKVTIDAKSGGKGNVRIDYQNLDQLDEILARLSGSAGVRLSN